jgi:hypothetical protein
MLTESTMSLTHTPDTCNTATTPIRSIADESLEFGNPGNSAIAIPARRDAVAAMPRDPDLVQLQRDGGNPGNPGDPWAIPADVLSPGDGTMPMLDRLASPRDVDEFRHGVRGVGFIDGIPAGDESRIVAEMLAALPPDAAAPDALIELTAVDGPTGRAARNVLPLRKKWRRGADGKPAKTSHPRAAWHIWRSVRLTSIEAMAAYLRTVRHSCLIRAAATSNTSRADQPKPNPERRLMRAKRHPSPVDVGEAVAMGDPLARYVYYGPIGQWIEAPFGRRWLTLDIDGIALPAGIAPTSGQAIRYIRSLLPRSLRRAAAVWQWSSSAGMGDRRVSGHLMIRLDRPILCSTAREWAERINRDVAAAEPAITRLLDDRTLLPTQPYYAAPPEFRDGITDPLGDDRIVVLDGAPEAVVPNNVPSPREADEAASLAAQRRIVERRVAAKLRRQREAEFARTCGSPERDARATTQPTPHPLSGIPPEILHGDPDGIVPVDVVPMAVRRALARRYLAHVPPAVEGSNGSARTHAAARHVVTGFGVDTPADFLAAIRDWNAECIPPWTETDLIARHFDRIAADVPRTPIGSKLRRKNVRREMTGMRVIDAPDGQVQSYGLYGRQDSCTPAQGAARETGAHAAAWVGTTPPTPRAPALPDGLIATILQGRAPGATATPAAVLRALRRSGRRGRTVAWHIESREPTSYHHDVIERASGAREDAAPTVRTEPRWCAADARRAGADIARRIRATFDAGAAAGDPPPAPSPRHAPLRGWHVYARTLTVTGPTLGACATVAGEYVGALAESRRLRRSLPCEAGGLSIIMRGHSTADPPTPDLPGSPGRGGSAALPVVIAIATAEPARGDVAGLFAALPLPPGSTWQEDDVAEIGALDLARLAEADKSRIPDWATDAELVAISMLRPDRGGLGDVRTLRTTGAVRAAWCRPQETPVEDPIVRRETEIDLDRAAVEEQATAAVDPDAADEVALIVAKRMTVWRQAADDWSAWAAALPADSPPEALDFPARRVPIAVLGRRRYSGAQAIAVVVDHGWTHRRTAVWNRHLVEVGPPDPPRAPHPLPGVGYGRACTDPARRSRMQKAAARARRVGQVAAMAGRSA